MKKRVIIGIFLIIVISIIAIYFFFPFDTIVKEKIEQSLGQNVSIERVNVKWNYLEASDISVKTTSGGEFLKIKELKVKLYFFPLLRKQVEIKEIRMESPHLYLIKNKKGQWQLPSIFISADTQKNSIKLSVKELKSIRGVVILQDEVKRSYIKLTDVNVSIKSNNSIFQTGNTLIYASAQFSDGGNLKINSQGTYPQQQLRGTLNIKDLNIKILRPYLSGDVKVKRGIISLDSDFSINNGYVKAPSVLKAKQVEIESKGLLMGIAAPLLIELLKKKEEVVVPFNFWGQWDNLQNDLESAIKKQITQEVGKTITSPLKTITRPLSGILKKGN